MWKLPRAMRPAWRGNGSFLASLMRRRSKIAHRSAGELQAGHGGDSVPAGGLSSRVRVDEWKQGLTGIAIGESDPLGAGGKPQTVTDFGGEVGRGGKGV